ncbi:regulatory protein GemA [Methylocystis parvus]|uniref:regulatory protein GemA n=1 Tax=Methylocystis parvus TaxID=134 RepID=UPI003C75D9F1
MLTTKQMRLVQAIKKHLGDEATYRHLLRQTAGVDSAKDLTEIGLNAFLAEAKRQGFKLTLQRSFGARRGMATPRQVALIHNLWAEWAAENSESALNAWLEHSYGISALRFLPSDVAAKAITGLRMMVKRRKSDAA